MKLIEVSRNKWILYNKKGRIVLLTKNKAVAIKVRTYCKENKLDYVNTSQRIKSKTPPEI